MNALGGWTYPTGWHIEGDLQNQVAVPPYLEVNGSTLAQVPLYLKVNGSVQLRPGCNKSAQRPRHRLSQTMNMIK